MNVLRGNCSSNLMEFAFRMPQVLTKDVKREVSVKVLWNSLLESCRF